MYLNNW